MACDFFHQQPHPETNETACTWLTPDAAPLRPADTRPASVCAGGYFQGTFYLAVVWKDQPQSVTLLQGKSISQLTVARCFDADAAVRTLSLTAEGETLLLGIHAEYLRIYDALKGTEIIALKVKADSAVLNMVQDTRYLVADGIITQLGMDWKPLDTCRLRAASTAEDEYALERRDALEMENRDCPGTIGGMLFCYRGWVYYACGDVFNRCGTPHTDTFLCRAKSWKGPYTRRYLTIPCGGGASFFTDDQDHLYAAIIGQEDSVVRGKAAILPLEMTDEGFIRPVRTAITEKTITATMHPLSVCDSIRDSFLYACPDGWYYLTGTTKTPHQGYWQGTSGIRLWRTKDFSGFESLGIVYDYSDCPDAWQAKVSPGHNAWAPEIVYDHGTYWITYSTAPGCGLLKSISGKPEGPYQDMGRVVMRGIDSGFFQEDDKLYLIWQNGMLARLNSICTSFEQEPTLLMPIDGQEVGYEGAGLIRVDGRYVLYAAEWNGDLRMDGSYDMMYSTADTLMGPYSPRRVLVPHGGHGSLFYDHDGHLCFSLFGNDRTASFRHAVGIGRIHVSYENGEMLLSPDNWQPPTI